MIRITRASDDQGAVLRIDGQLRSEDVDELGKEYRNVEGPAVLELTNLRSADAAGVALLLELVSLGAEVRGASPYIELLLRRKPYGQAKEGKP